MNPFYAASPHNALRRFSGLLFLCIAISQVRAGGGRTGEPLPGVQRVTIRLNGPPQSGQQEATLEIEFDGHSVYPPDDEVRINWNGLLTLQKEIRTSPKTTPLYSAKTTLNTEVILPLLDLLKKDFKPGEDEMNEPDCHKRCGAKISRHLPDYAGMLRTKNELTIERKDFFRLGPRAGDVKWDRSLLIIDPAVVDDPCRTFSSTNPCQGGTKSGVWTFGFLVSEMVKSTSVSPSDFVEKWLKTWTGDQYLQPGKFKIAGRPLIGQKIIDRWPRKTGAPGLDLEKAPFRLVAIVNRIDLAGNLITDVNSRGELDLGELSFVFTLDHQDAGRNFLVIFEYGVTVADQGKARDYARQWIDLSQYAPSSEDFRSRLETITTSVVQSGAGKGKPNDSALDQLRTNEDLLGDSWELRQFELNAASHHLEPAFLKNTPSETLRAKQLLTDFVKEKESEIVNGHLKIPRFFPENSMTEFGTGVAHMPEPDFYWKTMNNERLPAQFHLSMNTCNGCHGGETHDHDSGNMFVHIGHRRHQEAVNIPPRSFLLGMTMTDPRDGTKHEFNEMTRRARCLQKVYELDTYLPIQAAFGHKLEAAH